MIRKKYRKINTKKYEEGLVICIRKCSSFDRMKDYEVKQKRIFYSFLALNLMLTVSKRRILYTRLFSPIDFIIDSQYSYPRNFRSLSHPHSFHWHSTRSALVYERSINGKFNFIQTRDSYFSNSSRSIKIVYASVHSISCRYCNLYRLFG